MVFSYNAVRDQYNQTSSYGPHLWVEKPCVFKCRMMSSLNWATLFVEGEVSDVKTARSPLSLRNREVDHGTTVCSFFRFCSIAHNPLYTRIIPVHFNCLYTAKQSLNETLKFHITSATLQDRH